LPTREVAKHYGFSDVRLELKVCKIPHVPKPGRGYWAKKRSRKTDAKATALAQFGKTRSTVAHTRTEVVDCPTWSEDSGSPAPDPNSNASLGVAQEWASQSSLDIRLRSERLVWKQEQDKI